MKKQITKQEELQLRGLFALMRNNAKQMGELDAAAANILRTDEKDDYDAAYPLIDEQYGTESFEKIMREAGIKTIRDKEVKP